MNTYSSFDHFRSTCGQTLILRTYASPVLCSWGPFACSHGMTRLIDPPKRLKGKMVQNFLTRMLGMELNDQAMLCVLPLPARSRLVGRTHCSLIPRPFCRVGDAIDAGGNPSVSLAVRLQTHGCGEAQVTVVLAHQVSDCAHALPHCTNPENLYILVLSATWVC